MRAVLQRAREARVTVDGRTIGAIGAGLVALVGVGAGDTEADAEWIAGKIAELRIFEDDAGKMNRSATDVRAEILLVSQFTLYADTRKGRRPSFTKALAPALAAPLIDRVAAALRARGLSVATGAFGADMDVTLVNRGPVTIVLDSREDQRAPE